MGLLGWRSVVFRQKLFNFQQLGYIFGLSLLRGIHGQFVSSVLGWHIAHSSSSLSSVSPMPLSTRWCSIEKGRPASHNPVNITGWGKCFRNQFPTDYTHVYNATHVCIYRVYELSISDKDYYTPGWPALCPSWLGLWSELAWSLSTLLAIFMIN